MIHANIFHLSEIITLQSGFPFRGSIAEVPGGSVLAVQMKDVDPDFGVNWLGVLRTELPGRKRPDWLQPEDVLFVSRGTRFHAVCLDMPLGPAVCSPHFYHLRVKTHVEVLPRFVAWQINQPPFQRQLWQAAEGSGQLSIRRPVLESLRVSVPGLKAQQSIVELADLARQEKKILRQLIRNREHQLQTLAEKLAMHTPQPEQTATHP